MKINLPLHMAPSVYALADAILARNLARLRSAAGRRVPADELARIDAKVAERVRAVDAARAAEKGAAL